jgi:hypothetical protein
MLQEIPAIEQLLGLQAEPPVPDSVRFVFDGVIWPDAATLLARESKGAAESGLLDETMGWVAMMLQSKWQAPDLRKRLRAAKAIVSGQDAFLARYAMDGNKIQIVVSRSFVHLAILPASASMAAYAPLVMREFLQVDPPGGDPLWSGEPWATVGIAGFTFGYHPSSSLTGWRDSLSFLTDRRAVKFSARKMEVREPDLLEMPKSGSAPTAESEKHWFAPSD